MIIYIKFCDLFCDLFVYQDFFLRLEEDELIKNKDVKMVFVGIIEFMRSRFIYKDEFVFEESCF